MKKENPGIFSWEIREKLIKVCKDRQKERRAAAAAATSALKIRETS
jgi:hypothetical protein